MSKLIISKITPIILLCLLLGACGFSINPDKALLHAMTMNWEWRFEALLKSGANPNRIYGKFQSDWVMCAATQKGREQFLELAIQHGGDINLRNTTHPLTTSIIQSSESAPILCAIINHNMKAFDLLLDHDADLDIVACLDCKPFKGNKKLGLGPRWNNDTPITKAKAWNEYEMIYKMLQKRKSLREEEINTLIREIESGKGINLKSESYQWLLKVADWLREQGHEVTPRGSEFF